MSGNLIFYKLRDFSDLHLEIPRRRELYFAATDKLNDPLDCRIALGDALTDLIAKEQDDEIQKVWRQLCEITVFNKHLKKDERFFDALTYYTSKTGVLSLTLAITDTLIWSHYGHAHRGVAYGFQESYFEALATDYANSRILGVGPVTCCEVPPHEEIFRRGAHGVRAGIEQAAGDPIEAERLATLFEERFRNELIIRTLTSKYSPWAYEKEYRAVRNEPGSIPFPPNALVEVVFGLKAFQEDRNQVFKALGGEDFKHVRFREAHTVPNSFELQLRDL
jgi:hypothetical protein